jgi:uncharacterized protein (TIGR00251 family)
MPARIAAHVQPKAKTNEIVRLDGGTLRVKVTAAADGGKANKAVCELLAKAFGVPKRDVTLVTGQRNRNKVLEIALDQCALDAGLSGLPKAP